MFEVGWSEYLLIFGLALVVLGPEKLPKLAASIGRWVGRARTMARQFRDQLETEADSIRSSVQDVQKDFQSAASDIQSGVEDVKHDVESGLQEPQPEAAHEPEVAPVDAAPALAELPAEAPGELPVDAPEALPPVGAVSVETPSVEGQDERRL